MNCITDEFLNTLPMFNHQKLKLKDDIIFLKDNDYLSHIEKIYLFGSCSTGRATVKSDIDIGIQFKHGIRRDIIADIRSELNDSRKYGVETNVAVLPAKQCRLRTEILKGVILYE